MDVEVVTEASEYIYKEEELSKEGTYAKFAYMGHDGLQKYEVIHYNLDVIISVGYRVKSKRGTQFRQWANQVYRSEGQVFDFFVKRSITSAISAARTREIYSRFFSSLPAPFPAYLDFVALKL